MKNILICGDSFAADWSIKSTHYLGWPTILSQHFNVTNLAQAGCSEYKIYKQVSKTKLTKYDAVVIFHTSPYRIYVKDHPYLSGDTLHGQSDLIYNDIKHHKFPDQSALVVFFEKYFDLDYAKDVHTLIQDKINMVTETVPTLHLYIDANYPPVKNSLDISNIFQGYRGVVNHFNKSGNELVADKIKNWIDNDLH
jgi:hypothetical protein